MYGGGAERQLAYLAGQLGRIGWEVHVLITRRGDNWPRLKDSGAVIHEVSVRSAFDARLFGQLRRLVSDVKPDLIQAWLLQMEVLGGLVALERRKPWVFSERASEDAYPLSVRSLCRRVVARFASAIVSNSAAGDHYWRQRVGTRIRRYVIPNGIPLAEIAAAPAETVEEIGIGWDEPLVLFAGRLEPQKNLDTLLDACELVLSRDRRVKVLCCGQGSLRSTVDRWVETQKWGARFCAMGYTPRLWGLMKRAAVFVSPSLFEGSPNVVLEAMACGVPLVVSDIPEHRELLDDTSAILVTPQSAEALAEAIQAVIRDPAAAAERARAAKERAGNYGLPAIAQRYSDMYQEVLSAQGVR